MQARTAGFEGVRRVLASSWPDRIERITGVSARDMTQAVHLLANAERALILTARGAEQHSKGVDTVLAWINLALGLGKAGKEGCGYGCLTGQGNGQGGREHGQKADQLPGYRKIDNPEHRAHIARVWGIDPEDLPGAGRSAYEMLDTMGTEGGVRALLVMASNPVVSAPRAGHVKERLDALDFLAVSDIFLSETAERADVVLPVDAMGRRRRHDDQSGRARSACANRPITPPDGVRSDTQILAAIAETIGQRPFLPPGTPRDFRRTAPRQSGRRGGLQRHHLRAH